VLFAGIVLCVPSMGDSLAVKKDCIVILGKDGFTKMNHPLRYIETEDTEGNFLAPQRTWRKHV